MARSSIDLYLVRHAIAGRADPARWPDDAKRPLTREGIERFRAVADVLRRVAPNVELVLSSGYVRAWETARLLHEVAGWPAPDECPALEAPRPATGALEALADRPEASVALVGHEPYLSSLASLLCTGREDGLQLELKKGGVTLLRFDGPVAPGTARLRWSVAPKLLLATGA